MNILVTTAAGPVNLCLAAEAGEDAQGAAARAAQAVATLFPAATQWRIVEAFAEPDSRLVEIDARLRAIDQASVRPLRAIAAGTGTDDDSGMLAALDAEAAVLRGTRAAIAAP